MWWFAAVAPIPHSIQSMKPHAGTFPLPRLCSRAACEPISYNLFTKAKPSNLQVFGWWKITSSVGPRKSAPGFLFKWCIRMPQPLTTKTPTRLAHHNLLPGCPPFSGFVKRYLPLHGCCRAAVGWKSTGCYVGVCSLHLSLIWYAWQCMSCIGKFRNPPHVGRVSRRGTQQFLEPQVLAVQRGRNCLMAELDGLGRSWLLQFLICIHHSDKNWTHWYHWNHPPWAMMDLQGALGGLLKYQGSHGHRLRSSRGSNVQMARRALQRIVEAKEFGCLDLGGASPWVRHVPVDVKYRQYTTDYGHLWTSMDPACIGESWIMNSDEFCMWTAELQFSSSLSNHFQFSHHLKRVSRLSWRSCTWTSPGTLWKSPVFHSRIGKVLGESRGKLCARLGNPIDETHKYVVAVRLLHVLCIRDSTRQPSSHFESLRVTSSHFESLRVISSHFRSTDVDRLRQIHCTERDGTEPSSIEIASHWMSLANYWQVFHHVSPCFTMFHHLTLRSIWHGFGLKPRSCKLAPHALQPQPRLSHVVKPFVELAVMTHDSKVSKVAHHPYKGNDLKFRFCLRVLSWKHWGIGG